MGGIKMFIFLKQIFFSAKMFFGSNISNANPLKCVSMNNQACEIRPEIVNVDSYILPLQCSNK